jgi:hypothetical protein
MIDHKHPLKLLFAKNHIANKRKGVDELSSSSLAKGYDPLYSSSPLASLDGFSRSHGDGLYVMQLVVAATNQNALYKKHMFCGKNVNKIKMRVHIK